MTSVNLNKEVQSILTTIPNLGYRSEALATEDMGLYIKKVGNFFTSRLAEIQDLFSVSSNRLSKVDKKDISEQMKTILKLQTQFAAMQSKVDYSTVRNVETPVMLGQRLNVLDIVTKLNSIITEINKHLLQDIDNVDTIVSKMIADAQHRKTIHITNKFEDIGNRSSAVAEVIDAAIDPNGTLDRMPIGQVIPNIASIKDILEGLKELNGMFTYKQILLVKKAVIKLSDKVETLYDVLASDFDETITVSKGSLNEVSYGLENLAKYVTNSVTIFYILNQTSDNVKVMIELLKRFEK